MKRVLRFVYGEVAWQVCLYEAKDKPQEGAFLVDLFEEAEDPEGSKYLKPWCNPGDKIDDADLLMMALQSLALAYEGRA